MELNLAENWKVKCKKLGINQEVILPHSVEMNSKKTRRFTLKYTKTFNVVASRAEARHAKKMAYTLEFEGINANAFILLNGNIIGEHHGGFLPFSIDITRIVRFKSKNKLTIYVDNYPERDVLAGVPSKIAQYDNSIGVIRGIKLKSSEKVRFATDKNKGECFIYQKKSEEYGVPEYTLCADCKVKSNIKLEKLNLVATLLDNKGDEVNSVVANYDPAVKKDGFSVEVAVDQPELWSPDYPYLYTLKLELTKADKKTGEPIVCDTREFKRGIREYAVENGKLLVNGEETEIRGVCHHQAYPVIGMSTSKRAEYREVLKLKKAGFNTIRLIHYPASKEFYEACDTLGMMVINCMPSNGAFYNVHTFKQNALKAYKELANRDRNYTSVAMWEATLYETGAKQGMTDGFVKKCIKEIKKAFPKGVQPLIVGDTTGRKNPKKMHYDIAYCKYDKKTKTYFNPKGINAGLISRYGGEILNCNQVDVDDEYGMAIQAWSYQYMANRNGMLENCAGQIVEKDMDFTFNRGRMKNSCGIMNEYRLPKTSYYFYASQETNPNRKMVYMPSTEIGALAAAVPVFSNCDYIKVYVDGKQIGKYDHRAGEHTDYVAKGKKDPETIFEGKALDVFEDMSDYSKFIINQLYNGSNSDFLKFPPFMINNADLTSGKILIEGYTNDDELVAKQVVNNGCIPAALKINVDYSGIALQNDGIDFVFVHVSTIDCDDNLVNFDDALIELSIEGGQIITDNKCVTKGGICSFMIKANAGAENVKLSAYCHNYSLGNDAVDVVVKG